MRDRIGASLRRAGGLFLALAIAAFAIASVHFDWLWRANALLFDAQQLFVRHAPPADIVIIAIDEPSLGELGRWPWPRRVHARLLDKLAKSGVRAVALDVLFAEPSREQADDKALAEALEPLQVVLPVTAEHLTPDGQLIERLPLPSLAQHARLGHVHIQLDGDGIARGVFLKAGLGDAHWDTLGVALMRAAGRLPEERPQRPAGAETRYAWVREKRVLLRFYGPPGTFKRYSYAQVLRPDFPIQDLRDRTVLVGVTAAGLGDDIPTPVSGHGRFMPGVEFNATVAAAAARGDFVTQTGQAWRITLTLAAVLLAMWLYPRVPPQMAWLSALGVTGIMFLDTGIALYAFDTWFPPADALAAITLSYPLWSWRRLAAAMRFLHQELAAVHREQALDPTPAVPPLERTADYLNDAMPAAHWHSFELQRPAPGKARVGRWRQRDGQWQLNVKEPDGHRMLVANAGDPRYDAGAQPLRNWLRTMYDSRSRHQDIEVEQLDARILTLQAANAELRQLRGAVDHALGYMADGMLATDPLGRIILGNRRAAEFILNDPERVLIGEAIVPVLAHLPGVDWRQAVSSTLFGSDRPQFEVHVPGRDGPRELLVQLSRFSDGATPASLVVNLSDVRVLKENERRRAELVGFLSHDLRSPLVSLIAIAEMSGAVAKREELAGLFARARGYAENSLDMLEQFLGLTRAESSDGFRPIDMDLIQLAMNACDHIWAQAAAHHINVEQRFEPDEAWLHGDPDLLERALINLLGNAIKFSPHGEPVSLTVRQVDDDWVIEVNDTGPGIPEQDLPNIFNRFVRSKGHSGTPGVGLGLAFVDVVAQRHGGNVSVRNNAGRGTTFRIRLPSTPHGENAEPITNNSAPD